MRSTYGGLIRQARRATVRSTYGGLIATLVDQMVYTGDMNDSPPPPPYSFCVVASLPGGAGVELGVRLSQVWTVAAQATWLLALGDATVVARRHFSEARGLYLAAGPYGVWSPLLFPERFPVAPGLLAAVGGEWSVSKGLFFAAEIGGAAIYVPPGSEGGGNEWGAIPRGQVRLGGRW